MTNQIIPNLLMKNMDSYLKNNKKVDKDDSSQENKSLELIKNLFDSDDVEISDKANGVSAYYQSINIIQESTYAQFTDKDGNEFTFEQKKFTITFEEIWQKNKTLPESVSSDGESELEKLDKKLKNWSSDAVSDRLVDFAETVYNFMKQDPDYSELHDMGEFKKWATENILKGFNEASSILAPVKEGNDLLTDLMNLTYDKTMDKLSDKFGEDDEVEVEAEPVSNESVEYEQRYTEISVESTYIGVNLIDE